MTYLTVISKILIDILDVSYFTVVAVKSSIITIVTMIDNAIAFILSSDCYFAG